MSLAYKNELLLYYYSLSNILGNFFSQTPLEEFCKTDLLLSLVGMFLH